MQTLYIDVYFLINFSVDVLALYFASRLVGHNLHIIRLLLSGTLLSLVVCAYTLFWEEKIYGYFLLICAYLLAMKIFAANGGVWKWVALSLSFLLFSFMIGGVVFWTYSKLNILARKLNIGINNGAENKNVLIFSASLLVAIVVINILISFLQRKKSLHIAQLSFYLFGKKYELDALVDSGCFLIEPLSSTPVFLVKKGWIEEEVVRRIMDNSGQNDWEYKKKVRLVPVQTLGKGGVLVSVLMDNVIIQVDKKCIRMTLCMAFDEEGGTYGGYGALLPASVLNYV